MPMRDAAGRRRPLRAATLVLQCAALAACSTLPTTAREQFATDYRCADERVATVGPDTFEIVGCGRDVIYACTRLISNDAVLVPPSCRAK
jgi:hypothetical protein